MSFKKYIPSYLKIKLRLLKRLFNDFSVKFARKSNEKLLFDFKITTVQEIMPSAYFDNKMHNFNYVAQKINHIVIFPREVFSFWELIGNPNNNKNFKKGRNIVKGKINEEAAGGICQVSSILYYTAIKTNVEILERHNHSVDIYSEEERFTPLGADATLVYPYKDLRIKNNYLFPIAFQISVEKNTIICSLLSTSLLPEDDLVFSRNQQNNTTTVLTLKNGNTIAMSNYIKF